MWNWCEAECLLSQITWSPISSVVEWNLNIVFRMSYSHTNQWSLHSDRWLMVASKLFGQLHFCQFQLNSKSDIMKFVLVRKKVFQCAFSPVWPQADPWAQHHSVNQVNVCQWQYCIDQVWYCTHNNARPRFSSPPPQSLQSVCVCVCARFLELWNWKLLCVFKYLSLTNSKVAILKHSGCEETELQSELNHGPCCRSKSAKVGTENQCITFDICMSEMERQTDGVLMLFKGSSWRKLQPQ